MYDTLSNDDGQSNDGGMVTSKLSIEMLIQYHTVDMRVTANGCQRERYVLKYDSLRPFYVCKRFPQLSMIKYHSNYTRNTSHAYKRH